MTPVVSKIAAFVGLHSLCEEVLKQFAEAGVDVHALAQRLQKDSADPFVRSWNTLMGVISSKSAPSIRTVE